MGIMALLNRVLGRRPRVDERERLLQEAREFVASGKADRMPLHEFEKRFGIADTDLNSRSDGFPKSKYYNRIEDPEERERNRRTLEAFLAEH